jgi:hypothetical protein
MPQKATVQLAAAYARDVRPTQFPGQVLAAEAGRACGVSYGLDVACDHGVDGGAHPLGNALGLVRSRGKLIVRRRDVFHVEVSGPR